MTSAALLLLALATSAGVPPAFAPFENRPVTAIRFEGNRVTREYVIARELETRSGEVFHYATLQGRPAASRKPRPLRGDEGRPRGRRGGRPARGLRPRDARDHPPPFVHLHRGERLFLRRRPVRHESHGPRHQSFRPGLLRRDQPAVGPPLGSLDRRQSRVSRLLRRRARARRHLERVRRGELGVHARGGGMVWQERAAPGIGIALSDAERRGGQDSRPGQRGPARAGQRIRRVRHPRLVARSASWLEERARGHRHLWRRLLLDPESRSSSLPADLWSPAPSRERPR